MKKLFYSTAILLAGLTTQATAQGPVVNISWENVTYSGNTFSFDIVWEPTGTYTSVTSMDGANLRFIITTSTDLDVSTAGIASVATGYEADAVTVSPDPGLPNSDNFAVNVNRTGTDLLITPGTAFTLGKVTITMSGIIPDDATFTLLPAYATGDDEADPVSFWSYGGGTIATFDGDYEVPLPVEFTSFTAQKSNTNAVLNWTTAKEQNNIGFDIERSVDGKYFSKIGYVATKANNGNSSAALNYDFTDTKPANGVNYYRLKQHDMDSKFAYSKVASVTFGSEQAINVYPNPTDNQLTIDGINAGNVIRVVDINGKVVSELTASSAIETFNISNLASGIYAMQIMSENTVVQTTQIVKK